MVQLVPVERNFVQHLLMMAAAVDHRNFDRMMGQSILLMVKMAADRNFVEAVDRCWMAVNNYFVVLVVVGVYIVVGAVVVIPVDYRNSAVAVPCYKMRVTDTQVLGEQRMAVVQNFDWDKLEHQIHYWIRMSSVYLD